MLRVLAPHAQLRCPERSRARMHTCLALSCAVQEAPRKRKTLEAKRAVVLEKPEKAAASLLSQLNAIRNAKAEKRRATAARRREVAAKKAAKEAEWRDRCGAARVAHCIAAQLVLHCFATIQAPLLSLPQAQQGAAQDALRGAGPGSQAGGRSRGRRQVRRWRQEEAAARVAAAV